MKIAAIIPAYNEEKHIEKVVKDTKKYVDLVITIDDGSRDKTFEKTKDADIRLRHVINMGKGVALKTGIMAALQKKADLLITMDSDGQHEPDDIPRLVDKLKKEGLDVVIGKRPFSKNAPFIFKFGNWFLNQAFYRLFGLKVEDTQSGFRAIKASVVPKIMWKSQGYAVETEMLAQAGKNNLKCAEIPIKSTYLEKYKGTTVFDGIKIFISMLLWKIRRGV